MKQALLVIDLQNGIGPLVDADGLLARVNQRIAAARQHNQPIILIQHQEPGLEKGTEPWQLMAGLDHQPTDYYVDKTHPDSFYKTNLQQLLDDLGITTLEICGAQTEFCVDTTTKVAFDRGYTVVMQHNLSSTLANLLIPVPTLIQHYEHVWASQFVTFLDD